MKMLEGARLYWSFGNGHGYKPAAWANLSVPAFVKLVPVQAGWCPARANPIAANPVIANFSRARRFLDGPVFVYQSFHHDFVARGAVETSALLGKLVCKTRREASARSFIPSFS